MEFEKSEGYDDKFLPHPTSFTISDSADKSNPDENVGGRPKKEDSKLSANGIQTRTNGGNESPKPSTQ